MKKILSILAIAAMMCTVACNKDNKPKHHGNGGDEGDDYEAPIVIDGDFADWALLDATKVASCTLQNPDGVEHADLKAAKVYADAYFVYVYMEFNDVEATEGSNYKCTVFFNGDNDTSTGGYNFYGNGWDQGTTPCIDLMNYGLFIEDGEWLDTVEMESYSWSGSANGDGWNWADANTPGFIAAKCKANKGVELSFRRDLYPVGKLADEFTVGFMLQSPDDPCGLLPNAVPDPDTNPSGLGKLLVVKTDK